MSNFNLENILKGFGIILALSGWTKVFLDQRSTKPKIKGRVLQVMVGKMINDKEKVKTLTTFTTYVYLLNSRRNQMHILDYQMEVKINKQWIQLSRLYSAESLDSLSFSDSDGEPIKIENFNSNLVYKKNEPTRQGVPLHGWIIFCGDSSLYELEENAKAYRLTCIDANLKKHIITTKVTKFQHLGLLKEMGNLNWKNSPIPKNQIF